MLSLTGIVVAGNTQCDKNLVLTSSRTEYTDSSGNVQRTEDENTTIEIGKNTITISPGSRTVMAGTIRSTACNWKTPFKEGLTELKTVFEDNGNSRYITIRLEGKDGKVSFTVIMDDYPDRRIRVWPDTFREQ